VIIRVTRFTLHDDQVNCCRHVSRAHRHQHACEIISAVVKPSHLQSCIVVCKLIFDATSPQPSTVVQEDVISLLCIPHLHIPFISKQGVVAHRRTVPQRIGLSPSTIIHIILDFIVDFSLLLRLQTIRYKKNGHLIHSSAILSLPCTCSSASPSFPHSLSRAFPAASLTQSPSTSISTSTSASAAASKASSSA
jgi:hypothetical protein